jgi:prepilin-type N-terminal cleavage/methylation domain-containing protein
MKFPRKAFTLAEVLITLSIIGIIAAMTIPTLAHKIRNKILEIQFKNTYAKVTQALKRMQADMEVTNIGDYCAYYVKYVGYVNKTECLTSFKKAFNTNTKYIERTDISTFGSTDIKVHPVDNLKEALFRAYAKSDGTYISYMINSYTFFITIDTNGATKPNRLGYDIFMFKASTNTSTLVGFTPSNLTNERLESYEKYLETANTSQEIKDYLYSTYGSPCNYTSTQTSNGIGCGYYAIRNKCPDGSNKGYFECLK